MKRVENQCIKTLNQKSALKLKRGSQFCFKQMINHQKNGTKQIVLNFYILSRKILIILNRLFCLRCMTTDILCYRSVILLLISFGW